MNARTWLICWRQNVRRTVGTARTTAVPRAASLTGASTVTSTKSQMALAIVSKGAITTKIKHAIKHTVKYKTKPARLAQLLQPSLAFRFSLQPMTAYRPVLDGTPSLAAS